MGGTRQRGRRGAPGRIPEIPAPERHLPDPHADPPHDRQGQGRDPRPGERRHPAQGRRYRARHRRARRPHPVHTGTVRRRACGLSRPSVARGRRQVRCLVLHSDGDTGPEVHLPRQRRRDRQSLRPPAVVSVRRAGCIRNLRRCGGAAQPRVHRCEREGLQSGHDAELERECHAADDGAGVDEAGIRVGPRDRDGGSDRRQEAGRHSNCSASYGATRNSPAPQSRRQRTIRANGATASGFPTARRCRPCAP